MIGGLIGSCSIQERAARRRISQPPPPPPLVLSASMCVRMPTSASSSAATQAKEKGERGTYQPTCLLLSSSAKAPPSPSSSCSIPTLISPTAAAEEEEEAEQPGHKRSREISLPVLGGGTTYFHKNSAVFLDTEIVISTRGVGGKNDPSCVFFVIEGNRCACGFVEKEGLLKKEWLVCPEEAKEGRGAFFAQLAIGAGSASIEGEEEVICRAFL